MTTDSGDPSTERVRDSFVPIPMPEVIDESTAPRHSNLDGSSSADELWAAVQELNGSIVKLRRYTVALWDELTVVADYLREDIARGVTGSGVLVSDEDWSRWQGVYAHVLARLAGPHGDHGYGDSQATLERQNRSYR